MTTCKRCNGFGYIAIRGGDDDIPCDCVSNQLQEVPFEQQRSTLYTKGVGHGDNQYTILTPEQKLASYWNRVAITADDEKCWLWQDNGKKRYGYKVWEGKKSQAVHRISWMLVHGPIPNGMEICHSCDTPKCVNPKHLFLGTHQDNMDDMKTKGRHRSLRGEEHPITKLKDIEVADIRSRYAKGGISQRKLATAYNVNQALIWRIVHNLIHVGETS